MKNRTAICILTWNRLKILKNTINTFREFNPNIKDDDFIIVDNGSIDGTQEFLKSTNYNIILNKINTGAQMGKFICWKQAEIKDYDFIMFIENDHPCYKTVPIKKLENYLDSNIDVGIIRLNDKPYLRKHQITKLPTKEISREKLDNKFTIVKWYYHFTSHPSIFRTSLVHDLTGCIYPGRKPKLEDIKIEELGFEKYKGTSSYELAKQRVLLDYGVKEKEYMRLYLLKYRLTAQLEPACFKWSDSKRMSGWIN